MITLSSDRVRQILAKARSARIAVFGDLMLDTYISGSASRLSQEAPVPVIHIRKKEARPGGAANVMRNLADLAGCKVYAFGVIGDDQPGRDLMKFLKAGNIDTAGVYTDPTRPTTEKQRVLAGGQQVVRMDFEETRPVSTEILEKMAEQVKSLIRHGEIDAVIFEDYAKGLLVKDVMQDIVNCAIEHNVFTSLDPHPGHPMEVHRISLMTPNRSEAFSLAGIYCTDPANEVERDAALRKTADALLERWQPETLMVTLGHQGMILFPLAQPDKISVIPTVAREVFDVSGAGDTVIATYTLAAVSGANSDEAAVISNQAAGLVVAKAGTATICEAELLSCFQTGAVR